jgi:hypothetical protein
MVVVVIVVVVVVVVAVLVPRQARPWTRAAAVFFQPSWVALPAPLARKNSRA